VTQFDSRRRRDSVEGGTPSLRGSHLKWAFYPGARASCPRSDARQSASRSSPAKVKLSHYPLEGLSSIGKPEYPATGIQSRFRISLLEVVRYPVVSPFPKLFALHKQIPDLLPRC